MVTLEKRDNETPLGYHKRLISGKLIDKTLSDYDYTEISKYLYGKEYSADVARRMMYGSQRTMEVYEAQRMKNARDVLEKSNISDDLDSKLLEIKKERQKMLDQRRELNKLISTEGRSEHLHSRLAAAAENLNNTIGCVYKHDLNNNTCSVHDKTSAVLALSDWHYGMVTNNIYNEFNTEICKERVKNITKKACEKISIHNCEHLEIVVLGDLFHGAIHTSARVASEELVCEQLINSAELLAQSIDYISGYVDDVSVRLTYGNHARTVQNKGDSVHRDNMERIVTWWLKQRFKDSDRVVICDESDNEFICFDLYGHAFCASHGDLDSIYQSPRLLHTLFQKQFDIDLEYIILGDKHHHESFNELGITSVICGSLCGTDDYANDKRLFSTPSQLLLIVNQADGVDAEYKLKC